eukprot:CAMPEP_0194275516 /NCGR_PEP_ID=MMETSP0169-20130528/8334_1 /TAXON_ID=218684 /ORGANISM="Corethron pennatum, Strain L29A3" /LENGTH=245 /DNA_ID=CAMNT_0039018999 /DNA_START=60 /DNA_END=797 /DNA_ORIENTATION=-
MAADLPNTDASRSLTFPMKLHSILISERWSDIIKFEADGKKWKILDKKRMEEEVLPLHFRHNKYLSFTRSVIGWGFKRVGKATYYHKLFNRNAPDLCGRMLRNSASNRNFVSNNNPIPRPAPDRSHYYGNLPENNLINAYPDFEGREGIPPLYLRLQNNLHGMLQTGRRAPVQDDEHFQLKTTHHLDLNTNSPSIFHNRQGVPMIPAMSQDCMYREPVIHSPYYLRRDQMFSNGQTYTPGSVPHT